MNESVDRAAELLHALELELASKLPDHRFTASDLAMIDQLHTRGYAATVDLARKAGITNGMHVLDLGAGLGGPARYLAETYDCWVEAVDAEDTLVRAADYLTTRWVGPAAHVTFSVDNAIALGFPDGTFDLVWMQHVAMNIADRDRLYREVRRVLRPGGIFATYDVLRAQGDLLYPTPWAALASVSTVLTADETRDAIEGAGLRIESFSLETEAAREWARAVQALGAAQRPPGALLMRAALGENFRERVGNLGKNYLEGRADVAAIVARR